MNLFNISLRNIKKSWKDYSVYFMTLIIGVAIFYMFNSISHQSFMNDLTGSGYKIVRSLGSIIEGVSVLVAFVLGILMVYANHFLIRRRKKEFGVYMMLGMGKNDVSKIIVGETLVVGVISLIAGLLIGIFGSQFLCIIVGKMFLADVSQYAFLLSGKVVLKTVINFAVIFLVVLIFNTVTISKYNLIDLLQAGKKGEKQIMKNKVLSVILFIIAIIILAVDYYFVGFRSDLIGPKEMAVCILSGIVATFMLFYSLAGFLLGALKKNKKLYYSKLNMFVVRQLCAGVNSSAVSMALISLMLFMAISAFSLGFSVSNMLNDAMAEKTPVDVTLAYVKDPIKMFEKKGYPVEQWLEDDYLKCPIYSSKYVCMGDTFGNAIDEIKEQFPYAQWDMQERIMKVSDYNRVAKLFGIEELEMKDDEYAISCNVEVFKNYHDKGLADGGTLKIGDKELKPMLSETIYSFIIMSSSSSNAGVIILPDQVVEDTASECKQTETYLAGNYIAKGKKEQHKVDKKLEKIVAKYIEVNYDDFSVEMDFATRNEVLESSAGLSVLATFLVMYIGIVFIISSAAILALKALSDSIDSGDKYQVLSKIGTEKAMMERSLFTQNLIHFGLPLAVGVVHSVFGIRFAKVLFVAFGMSDMMKGVLTTAFVMLVVYGGYMIATYFGCRRIVINK